jgi:hypothetical protein
MATLPDLEPPLISFQHALKKGIISVNKCVTDSNLFVHMDEPAPGDPRMTFVRMQDQTVTAMVMISIQEPIKGLRCFGIGWVVPEKFRSRGRAAEIAKATIKELQHNFAKQKLANSFYVEAIIDETNKASQATAVKVLGPKVKDTVDKMAGVPVVQHYRLIDADTVI